jgi:hypothetical protein
MQGGRRQSLTSWLVVVLWFFVVFKPGAVNAQDDQTVPVQFAGHSFLLPRSLADGFSAFIVSEPTSTTSGADSLQPPRTEFRLQWYTAEVATPRAVGWVNIYDASDLQEGSANAQYMRLQYLLSERPNLTTETALPTLYLYQQSAVSSDRYSEFFVNAGYLEAAGYQGITFVYGRVIHANERQSVLFYRVYFEGLSPDGQRYLSAQVEGTQELIASLDGITDLEEYVDQAQALFSDPVDANVVAWLAQANTIFASFDYAGS